MLVRAGYGVVPPWWARYPESSASLVVDGVLAACSTFGGQEVDAHETDDTGFALNHQFHGRSQSFTVGAGEGDIRSVCFKLAKTGSPTGIGTIGVYSISGTHGSSALPNAPLAVTRFDVSTLTGTSTLVGATLSGLGLSPGDYAAVLLYAGGDASNFLTVRADTGLGHGGNMAGYSDVTKVWAVTASADMVFKVRAAVAGGGRSRTRHGRSRPGWF